MFALGSSRWPWTWRCESGKRKDHTNKDLERKKIRWTKSWPMWLRFWALWRTHEGYIWKDPKFQVRLGISGSQWSVLYLLGNTVLSFHFWRSWAWSWSSPTHWARTYANCPLADGCLSNEISKLFKKESSVWSCAASESLFWVSIWNFFIGVWEKVV